MAETIGFIIILCCGAAIGILMYIPKISMLNIFKNVLIEEKVVATPLADQYLKDGFAYVNIDGIRIRVPSLSKEEEEIEIALESKNTEEKILPMNKTVSQAAYDNTNNRIFWATGDGKMGNFKLQPTFCTTGAAVQNFISADEIKKLSSEQINEWNRTGEAEDSADDYQPLTEGELKKIFEREQRKTEIGWVKKQQDAAEVSQFFFEFKEEFDRKLRLIPSIKDRYILIRKKMNDTISALDKIETKISNLEKRYNY